ncbi:hypothetical protein PtrSN002B_003059 [Pyrenophora tritici-repentis]|uniref:DUF7730 domain-containing protein n=2 Tax=Pyrenophora tritici-repentis TaxID=45151 RepID=A0A2W1E4A3_9PLEO|nr:uncharacterized protein PTRG_07833 [Pyrenophora tritici-repentis Pt-1C-BFP]KAA8616828.1 hypothetical protein PtrV1_10129 [Pyrenophora tritici-repentis]EDU50752.1 hypothetical protein PTRG_07833 [Pyrenophora tritici-repentis Pt-1C-BFP]KAF7446121.1 hypothetical protein A1F99_094120 [Pyrenophora tritici-repentis]KAG9381827.1 hypothetical protein A1F94_007481 [Pyrenophora tritici-repentis]KAI0588438.1 hypothetical protein Alg215_00876 [Pyrenophora tritici-repentis]
MKSHQRQPRVALSKDDADRLTLQNQQESLFLRLPGELRNRIYEYAFSEQCILVGRSLSSRLQLAVEPNGFSPRDQYKIPRYNFTRLLAIAMTCRQVYAETALLIFRLNDFRFHHVETIKQFLDSVPAAKRRAITALRLALYPPATEDNLFMLEDCGMNRFRGLCKIIVEMREWPKGVRNNAVVREAFQRLHLKALAYSVMATDVEVVFE